MQEPEITALIVARPGQLRDGIAALITAMPRIGSISQAYDGPAALVLIREHCYQVVVLDWDSRANDIPEVITAIKAECPGIRSLVLADSIEQRRQAEEAGADVTVMKGFPAARLAETLSRLLME